MEYCEYCRYYVNGCYYCSVSEAIEAITSDCGKNAYSLNEFPIGLFPEPVQHLPEHHNCRNCGAPVFGYKCDYCGTKY